MTDFPSLEFRWRYTPSLFSALPLAPVKFLHVNVLLLYYLVAVLFVLCLAICSLCSVLPSFAPVPCNASINKSCASHFCPVRVRILWLLAAVIKNCLSVPFTYRTLCGRASLPPSLPYPFHFQLTQARFHFSFSYSASVKATVANSAMNFTLHNVHKDV